MSKKYKRRRAIQRSAVVFVIAVVSAFFGIDQEPLTIYDYNSRQQCLEAQELGEPCMQ